ncbi:MAG: restriction endonuclease [Chloroflexota bacterium]|nr:restriction endonuclease [Chloroflexota bacterium]
MMTPDEVRPALTNPAIEVQGFRTHNKASEEYVIVRFQYLPTDSVWEGWVPYQYRRIGLAITTADQLAQWLDTIYAACAPAAAGLWVQRERDRWQREHQGKPVTKAFFDRLLNLEWNCIDSDLPRNGNSQRRIQAIKEAGYLLATDTRRFCAACAKNTTHIRLIPYEKGAASGYEVFSPQLKRRIIALLGAANVYEARVVPPSTLIPDHKFPEIRWAADTRRENPDTISDDEIRAKFQLLDNQRNQQKREVCRQCYQTDKRGQVYGIPYYYAGDANWPADVSKRGKAAEAGCVGCPWYDLQAWRDSLNRLLKGTQV